MLNARSLLVIAIGLLVLFPSAPARGQTPSPELTPGLQCVATGICFCVRPAFASAIADRVQRFRSQLAEARKDGKATGYVSTPLSSGGGANFGVNRDAAAQIKGRLESELGSATVFLLNPGSPEADLPDIGQMRASQGEYMFLWAQVLSGTDGYGTDLDLVYFVGPKDFDGFFASKQTESSRMARVAGFFDRRYAENSQFKKEVDDGKVTRGQFIVYYAIKASVAFSRGAHDEWNIVSAVNLKRTQLPTKFGVGGLLAVWFDGGSVEPGDYADLVAPGNQATSCAP